VNEPEKTLGMSHVALYVRDLAACEDFYCKLLGMQVEWRPDEANVYLSSGNDNLALHHQPDVKRDEAHQRLDHIGFFIASADEVDEWFEMLQQEDVKMRTQPRTHRDGARSFYCFDPDGTVVQMLYHPPISG